MLNKMRQLILLICLCNTLTGQATSTKAKKAIGVSFQKIDIGHGLQLDFAHKMWQNWQLNGGLYVHINAKPTDDQNHGYHNRGWGTEWYTHIGVNFSIQRNIITYQSTSLYGFYNVHLLKIGFREKVYNPIAGPSGLPELYELFEGDVSDPIVAWENSIGIGVSTLLTERIGFFVRGGLGVSMVYNKDPNVTTINPFGSVFGTEAWEGMTMLSSGIFYTF